jgi:hypothetical protein
MPDVLIDLIVALFAALVDLRAAVVTTLLDLGVVLVADLLQLCVARWSPPGPLSVSRYRCWRSRKSG